MRQEQRKDLWPATKTTGLTHNTLGLLVTITRCLQRVKVTWEDAFVISLKDDKKSLSTAEKTGSSERSIEGCETESEGIDKTASLHLLRSKQLAQW